MTPEIMRRLAFVKYLFRTAAHQTAAPEIHAAAAVLTFHDAVELFLSLGSEYRDANAPKRATFEEYWAPLADACGGNRLPGQVGMRRLNDARVALKHRGQLPARSDIQEYAVTVASFFEEATPLVFGVEFRLVSLVQFVEPERARAKLDEALAARAAEKMSEAIGHVAVAFELMLLHHDEQATKADMRPYSPFSFDAQFKHISMMLNVQRRDDGANYELAKAIEDVGSALSPMQSALRIIALGLDFRRYVLYRAVAPTVQIGPRGGYRLRHNLSDVTEGGFAFCYDYVIDSAVKLSSDALPDLRTYRPMDGF